MLTVVTQLMLGRTRVSGYVLYNSENHAFEEYPPSEVKHLIRMDAVQGLKLDTNGEIVLNTEELFNNLPVKSGVGNFHLMKPSSSVETNRYAVTQIKYAKDLILYEIVSNYCQRDDIMEDTLVSMIRTGVINGAALGDDDKILVSDKIEAEHFKGCYLLRDDDEWLSLEEMDTPDDAIFDGLEDIPLETNPFDELDDELEQAGCEEEQPLQESEQTASEIEQPAMEAEQTAAETEQVSVDQEQDSKPKKSNKSKKKQAEADCDKAPE